MVDADMLCDDLVLGILLDFDRTEEHRSNDGMDIRLVCKCLLHTDLLKVEVLVHI